MEGAFATIGWPAAGTWGVFAFGAALALAAHTHRHVRRAFHQWRLDRRLTRDAYILREELNEYELAIGEELDPLHPVDVVKHVLLGGALAAAPSWFAQGHLELWWEAALFAFGGLGLLFAWWHWLNDPESDPDVLKLPKGNIPFDALAGFGAAAAVIGIILLAIWLF